MAGRHAGGCSWKAAQEVKHPRSNWVQLSEHDTKAPTIMISSPMNSINEPKKKLGTYSSTEMGAANRINMAPVMMRPLMRDLQGKQG